MSSGPSGTAGSSSPRRPGHDEPDPGGRGAVAEQRGDDDGDKRRDFQSLPSLQAYVLVAQDQRCVRIYRRDEAGQWLAEAQPCVGGERFSLPSLEPPVSVDEVYDNILDEAGRSLPR